MHFTSLHATQRTQAEKAYLNSTIAHNNDKIATEKEARKCGKPINAFFRPICVGKRFNSATNNNTSEANVKTVNKRTHTHEHKRLPNDNNKNAIGALVITNVEKTRQKARKKQQQQQQRRIKIVNT